MGHLLQMLEMTTKSSAWWSLPPSCWCVLVVALPRLSCLQTDFQLINRLGFQLEFMVLFQHGTPNLIVQWVQIWRVWGQWFFSMNPGQFACSQSCVMSAVWIGVAQCHLDRRWSLDCLHGCQWWSLRASAVKVHLQFSIHTSSPKSWLFSEPST